MSLSSLLNHPGRLSGYSGRLVSDQDRPLHDEADPGDRLNDSAAAGNGWGGERMVRAGPREPLTLAPLEVFDVFLNFPLGHVTSGGVGNGIRIARHLIALQGHENVDQLVGELIS